MVRSLAYRTFQLSGELGVQLELERVPPSTADLLHEARPDGVEEAEARVRRGQGSSDAQEHNAVPSAVPHPIFTVPVARSLVLRRKRLENRARYLSEVSAYVCPNSIYLTA